MFQSDVFTIAGWLPSPFTMNGVDEVYWVSRAQLIIALGSTIPGYWFTVATIEIMGRIPIQVPVPPLFSVSRSFSLSLSLSRSLSLSLWPVQREVRPRS